MKNQSGQIIDISEFKNQRDDLRFLIWPTLIAIIIILTTTALFGLTIFNVVGSTFVLIVALAFYYSNYTRQCSVCGDKMTKDNSHGLICEKQYCVKCKTKVDIRVRNPHGR